MARGRSWWRGRGLLDRHETLLHQREIERVGLREAPCERGVARPAHDACDRDIGRIDAAGARCHEHVTGLERDIRHADRPDVDHAIAAPRGQCRQPVTRAPYRHDALGIGDEQHARRVGSGFQDSADQPFRAADRLSDTHALPRAGIEHRVPTRARSGRTNQPCRDHRIGDALAQMKQCLQPVVVIGQGSRAQQQGAVGLQLFTQRGIFLHDREMIADSRWDRRDTAPEPREPRRNRSRHFCYGRPQGSEGRRVQCREDKQDHRDNRSGDRDHITQEQTILRPPRKTRAPVARRRHLTPLKAPCRFKGTRTKKHHGVRSHPIRRCAAHRGTPGLRARDPCRARRRSADRRRSLPAGRSRHATLRRYP